MAGYVENGYQPCHGKQAKRESKKEMRVIVLLNFRLARGEEFVG
jgi:hypothetical protein